MAGGKLKKISVEGGAVVPLADITGNFGGAAWSEDGSLYATIVGKGLERIPAGGGQPEMIVEAPSGKGSFVVPQLLPGGKALLLMFFTSLDVDQYTIEVLTLADRHRKIVARGGHNPMYLPPPDGASSGAASSGGLGHLIYLNKATLFAVPFDLAKLETRGTPKPVLDDVAYNSAVKSGQLEFSPAPSGHGTLVYRRNSGGASGMRTLQWVDPTGKKEPLRAKPGVYQSSALSPDGKRVALTVTDAGQDTWVYDPQRDAMTRLTFGGSVYYYPVWSPDGQYVVFLKANNGIFQARADGSGQPQPLTQSNSGNQMPYSFTPDGKRLAYTQAGRSAQIWTVPLEDQGGRLKAGKPEQFLTSAFADRNPAFSPDGRWLAYESNESGRNEVYVRAFLPPSSGQAGKWQISNSGGTFPRWSRNGHELMYQAGDQIMAASYTAKGDTFVAEKPRVWLANLGAADGGGIPMWDLAPDGKRAVAITPIGSAEASKQDHELVFLQNFVDELQRKVPAGK
ncbi:MAG: hypothetical protein ABSG41_29580 [Bryobacteraceae bacterium]